LTIQDFLNALAGVQSAIDAAGSVVEGLDPALAIPIEAEKAVEALAQTAITAWSNASGTPITVASVQALLPNPAPLTPPTS
jgi:hypothetical protein